METYSWKTPWGARIYSSSAIPADGFGAPGDFCLNSAPGIGKPLMWAAYAVPIGTSPAWRPADAIAPLVPGAGGSLGTVMLQKFHLKHGDFSAAELTKTVDVWDVPANAKIVGVTAKLSEIFAGTTTLVIDVGDAGDADRYIAAYDGMVAVAATNLADSVAANGLWRSYSADSHKLKVKATATVANLDQLTTGEIDIWVAYVILP